MGNCPVPITSINVHAEYCKNLSVSLVRSRTDDKIVYSIDIGGFMIMLPIDRVFIFEFHPPTAFG